MTFRLTLRFADPREFLSDEGGSMSIETLFMLPVMIFMFVVGYQYFDGYRREAAITKANFAVADLISRRRDLVTPDDLEGLGRVFEEIVFSSSQDTYMRFTEVIRTPNGLEVVWSYATDQQPAMRNARLQGLLINIPRIEVNERLVVVESYTYDQPFFRPRLLGDLSLGERIIKNVTPISPRFDPRIAFAPNGEEGIYVTPNDTDCDEDAPNVGGGELVGPGNCNDP